MIIFHCWNNSQIINVANIKVNLLPDEEADLILLYTDSVSQDLVQAVSDANIFRNICTLGHPIIDNKKLILGKIPKIRMLFHRHALKKYYARFLSSYEERESYTHIYVPGFWSNTVYYIDFFYRLNPKIKISFYDEGISSLYFSKKELIWFNPVPSKVDKMIRMLDEGLMRMKYSHSLSNEIYLYGAGIYSGDDTLTAKPIPLINSENPVCESLLKAGSCDDNTLSYRYERCEACYVACPLVVGYEDNHNYTYKILGEIAAQFGDSKLIIKTHPVSRVNRTEFGKQFEPKAFVDRNVYLFESHYTKIDFTNKLLIARNSASLLFPKLIYGQEPYIMFIHRLYSTYHQFGEDIIDQYVEDLKKLYSDPSKIMVPNSLFDLNQMLSKFKKAIHRLEDLDDEIELDPDEEELVSEGGWYFK